MTSLIVCFKLKPGADQQQYEAWARHTDLPIVRDLPSVDGFRLQKVDALFGTDTPAPYDYVEVIDITDMEQFGADVATDTMARVASQFREFADNPIFLVTTAIE